jgi:hypothetical protein
VNTAALALIIGIIVGVLGILAYALGAAGRVWRWWRSGNILRHPILVLSPWPDAPDLWVDWPDVPDDVRAGGRTVLVGLMNQSGRDQRVTITAETACGSARAVETVIALAARGPHTVTRNGTAGVARLRLLTDVGREPLAVGSRAQLHLVGEVRSPLRNVKLRWSGMVRLDRFFGHVTRPGSFG